MWREMTTKSQFLKFLKYKKNSLEECHGCTYRYIVRIPVDLFLTSQVPHTLNFPSD